MESLAGVPAPGRSDRGDHRRWRWPHTVLVVLAVLVVGCVIADHVELDDYVLTPGTAQPVGPLIKVPAGKGHRVTGRILLTDVYVTQVTALSYLFNKLNADAQVLPAATVLGPGTPPSQLVSQGYLEMAQSQAAAKAAALSRLGYVVGERDAGTLVFAVQPGAPASGVLKVGQIVTAVDGAHTPDACSFAQALARHAPGQRVQLSVEESYVTTSAVIKAGPIVRKELRLARWPASLPRPSATPACPGAATPSRGYLGIEAETQQDFSYPLPVSVRTTQIGGPSAGLAMTLGIIDTLSGGKLTGGRTVAATGTIDPSGSVGEVGGIPQKTVAVERAGATAFFVPAAQRSTAESKATPSLHVYGVRSLAQVLSDLRRLGGDVPASTARGS
jgi:Lon-like protease